MARRSTVSPQKLSQIRYTCNRCSLSFFKVRASGRTPKWCPECKLEVERERDRERHAASPERKRAAAQKWYYENRERALAGMKAKYDANPEPKRAAARRVIAADPEQNRQRTKDWRKANPAKRQADLVRRRARKRGLGAEVYDRLAVFDRDGWVCQLCAKTVRKEASGHEEDGPTIDHIVPLAHGGPDALDNVQLAHRSCNTRKGARLG